jgi:DNA recombination protein RmuC
VSELGKQLYERLTTFSEHFARVRRGLDQAVGAYNESVGSLERSVLPAARRFPDLGVPVAKELTELEPIDKATRAPQAPELVVPAGSSRPGLPASETGAGGDVADAA